MTGLLQARIHFVNYDSNIVIKETDSKLMLNKSNKVTGWSEFSIVKKFGDNDPSVWVEPYDDGVVISQEGSEEPTTNLIISNSNAINYGIKNNSNAIVALATGGVFEEIVRTTSHAFLYCCKNTSNALVYGLKNNSNAIVDVLAGEFTPEEKAELLEVTRTTSNAFLYCCKNTSNALVYGLRNNSNAIMAFPLTICGCSDECCEPVTRSQDIYNDTLRDAPLRKAQARPQGERGRRAGACPSEPLGRMSEASWSPDKKFLAVITGTEEGQEIRVYASEFETLYDGTLKDTGGLRLVTHAKANDGACMYSVAWSDNGFYLAVEKDVARGDDMFVYSFDAQAECLSPLPNIDMFLKSI